LRTKRLVSSLRDRERGVSTVTYALVLPLFILLVFGTFEQRFYRVALAATAWLFGGLFLAGILMLESQVRFRTGAYPMDPRHAEFVRRRHPR